MSQTNNHKDRKKAYATLLQKVSAILYKADPYEIGESIDAPKDEYDDYAEKLIGELSRTPLQSLPVVIKKRIPPLDQPAVEAITAAYLEFHE